MTESPEPPSFETKITLRIHYYTNFGDSLWVCGGPKALGAWNPDNGVPMFFKPDGTWEVSFAIPYQVDGEFEYKYFIKYSDGSHAFEAGKNRKLRVFPKACNAMLLEDAWRAQNDTSNALFSSAFTKVVFRRTVPPMRPPVPRLAAGERLFVLTLRAPRISSGLRFCVSGSAEALGAWNPAKAVVLDDSDYPEWRAYVVLPASISTPVAYKYGIYDEAKQQVLSWEEGGDRVLPTPAAVREGVILVRNDEGFRYPAAAGQWRGAGVAVPVFSLRTERGCGVGEFDDIRLLVDWAKKTGLRLVQILPVNDTVATHTWMDSYPYAAISVIALHPIYANMESMGKLKDAAAAKAIAAERERLNALDRIDYEGVMAVKSRFYKLLYDQDRDEFLADPEYRAFFEANRHWLVPYAAFSCLRDRFGTVNYNWWPEFSSYREEEIARLADPASKSFDDVAVHYFIQYHLHKQLLRASTYAREKGVVLKGDLPIGIFRYSVDAWTAPHLYHMECQTGAPPDDFSAEGQNWGFPTYNWSEMAKDNYAWWRSRLGTMSNYFDAFRIDHILGFFRIWEIPYHAIQGLLGQFNPAYPFGIHELQERGLHFDYDRLCKPYIRRHMLDTYFGSENVPEAIAEFLNVSPAGAITIKPQFATQRAVEDYVNMRLKEAPEAEKYYRRVKAGMFGLIGEVLLLEAPGTHGKAYTPRIACQFTWSYKELDGHQQDMLNKLYVHYFYQRQEGLWYEQARKKLPAIKSATDMLVCGEDLGMVPKCVPPTMEQLQILSLNVQRMPKDPTMKFFHPSKAPYLSVVTPSSHDTSTLRGWWEENRDVARAFFVDQLGRHDEPPLYCEDWLVRELLAQHLWSPAMWAIIPIQDFVGMNARIRRENPHEERINLPSNPKHYWRFRFHLSLEQLLKEDAFNADLLGLVTATGRNTPF